MRGEKHDLNTSTGADKNIQWEHDVGFRALLVCKVTLGQIFRTHDVGQLPQGYDSINSLPGRDFQDEGYVVFDGDALSAAFVVIYSHPRESEGEPRAAASSSSRQEHGTEPEASHPEPIAEALPPVTVIEDLPPPYSLEEIPEVPLSSANNGAQPGPSRVLNGEHYRSRHSKMPGNVLRI